ncbi:MAG: thymidylate kinase [Firmicutes bacterium]|nr:thymidylate kinase [Bacillota bacterium]
MEHTLIVIEGTDGSGKKTQTERLYKFLKERGDEVITLSFPNYDSPSSALVKSYLSGELGLSADCLDPYQASILFAADRVCTMKQIYSKLEKPTTIILDRYVQSNMTHQAGKIKDREDLDKFLDWLDDFEFGVLKLPRVDKVVFLDVPVDISFRLSQERGQLKIGEAFTQDIHEADKQHLLDTYNAAMHVAKKYGWSVINCIDAEGNLKSVKAIHELVKQSL